MGESTTDTGPGCARDAFIARIRAALGRVSLQAPAVPPPMDESIVRLAGAEDDLVGLFQERAERVGMVVHRLKQDELLASIKSVLADHGARRVVVAMADPGQIVRSLPQWGFELVDGLARDGMDQQFDADAGITDVHAALAETGTMICNSSASHTRGGSLIPTLHIPIVRRRDILPDMIDYWAGLRHVASTDLPSSITMITGPSKTADIEAVLITGVHGPKHVHIMLVEDA